VGEPAPDEDALLVEQLDYYRARAPEYEDWWYRRGAYRLLPRDWDRWRANVAAAEEYVDRFGPTGRILELACGTGLWTRRLARSASHLTAVDAAPEVLELNRSRLPAEAGPVTFVEADVFAWDPAEHFDVVFFSFWLSHVPPSRFEDFWAVVDRSLDRDGRFLFLDSGADEANHEAADGLVSRRTLSDGRDFRIVKRFFEPEALDRRLRELGWEVEVTTVGSSFVGGWGQRR